MSKNLENNTNQDFKKHSNGKISIILDSNDINGFIIQFGVFIITWIILGNLANYLAQIDYGFSFLIISVIWFMFLVSKIASIRANLYEQIIDDLENDIEKLKKTNQLLNNMLQNRKQ